MTRMFIGLAALTLVLAACAAAAPSAPPTAVPPPAEPTRTPPPTATAVITPTPAPETAASFTGEPLPADQGKVFSASGACVICHSRMTDEAGKDVSIDNAWRASMMANAGRDPYWQASVRAEVDRNPSARSTIEDLCATCHVPMARFTDSISNQPGKVLDDGYLDTKNPEHSLALDGVSCTVCHQIRATNLGPSSYDGRFSIDPQQKQAFGPYAAAPDQAAIMQSASGYQPLQGMHLSRSELCATCHVLYIPTLDAAGHATGEQFPEQVPYLEWFYSDYRSTQTCQDCHLPAATGGVKIATTSPDLRSPFGQHTFSGGNAYMLGLLQSNYQALGVTASGTQFQTAIADSLDLLKNRTATVSLDGSELAGSRLAVEVTVENKAGHKFPTGFPARRAWIHLTVTDAAGQVVFESGGVKPDGAIVGNDNDDDPAKYEPHYATITRPDQVQIYEAILKDSDGAVTTGLMRAAGYLKDNRLLPSGFEKSAPYPDIAVWGEALADPAFVGGSDKVEYRADVSTGHAPFTVQVELDYQSIGLRWMENLRGQTGAEIDRFLGFVEGSPNQPIVIAGATTVVK